MGKEITKSEFEESVLKADKPVLVDFYAPWCGPCQITAPVIDEIAEEFKDKAYVYKINIDKEHELANQYQVLSLPTIFIFRKGEIAKQFNSIAEKQDIIKYLS